MKNVQQDHRTVEQEATFIHQMACWATIGPNIPGAVNTVIKLVDSVSGTPASWRHLRGGFSDGVSQPVMMCCYPGMFMGPIKKVLKRWALKKEI